MRLFGGSKQQQAAEDVDLEATTRRTTTSSSAYVNMENGELPVAVAVATTTEQPPGTNPQYSQQQHTPPAVPQHTSPPPAMNPNYVSPVTVVGASKSRAAPGTSCATAVAPGAVAVAGPGIQHQLSPATPEPYYTSTLATVQPAAAVGPAAEPEQEEPTRKKQGFFSKLTQKKPPARNTDERQEQQMVEARSPDLESPEQYQQQVTVLPTGQAGGDQLGRQMPIGGPVGVRHAQRNPTHMHSCPYCSRPGRTRVRTSPNWFTWLFVGGLVLFFWSMQSILIFLSWIPLVIDAFKRTDHYCTRCNEKVATVPPFADCCVKHR